MVAPTKFPQGDASRIVSVIDGRINKTTRSGSKIEHTWGVIASVAADGMTAGAYLYGETDGAYISQGFRVKPPMYPTVGDKVRVAIDYGKGERWIEEIHPTGTYHRVTIEPSTGEVEFGSGSADKDTRLYRPTTKTLTIDDHAGGAATLNVIGNIKQGGVQVALTSDIPAASGTVASGTTLGTASNAGAAATFSKGDHQHGTVSSGAVTAQTSYGLSSSNGSAGTVALSDHTHGTVALPTSSGAGFTVPTGTLAVTGGTLTLSTDARIYRSAATTVTMDDGAAGQLTWLEVLGGISVKRTTTASNVIRGIVSGDTTAGFQVNVAGKMEWGPGGSTAVDTNLYRDAASVLRSDDTLRLEAHAPTGYDKGGTSDSTTITTAGTYYALTNAVTGAITPAYIGQRFLCMLTGFCSLNTTTAQYALVRLDIVDGSDTQITTLGYTRHDNPGVSGRGSVVQFAKVWTADATSSRKLKAYGTTQTTNGLSLTLAYTQMIFLPLP
jgi:hypothetical protein